MAISFILLFLAVLVAIYCYVSKRHNVFEENGIPHIPPKPIVGNLGPLIFGKFSMPDFLQRVYDLNPEAKYVGVYEFSKPVILLRDVDLIKTITVKNSDAFQDHQSLVDPNLDPLLGGILFSRKSDDWKNMRSTLSPTFTSSKMRGLFLLMSNCAINFADYVSKLPEEDREFKFLTSKYTNDVIANCVYGINVDSKKEPNNPFYLYGKETNVGGLSKTLKIILFRNMPWVTRLLGIRLIRKEMSDFFQNLTYAIVKLRDDQGISKPDFTQLLMDSRNKKEPGKGLTTYDISVHAYSFFFGGYDTVSTALAFALYHLATNPETQERLQNEIDQVIGNTQGEVSYDIIAQMEYLDAVLNETLRINPVLCILDRVCVKRFELPPAVPGGKPFVVEPGMNLWISSYALHQDPNYYENPKKFDPERFLVDGKRIINSATYVPFGIGPRACIGNRFAMINMKVLLFHLLARCSIKKGRKTKVPLELAEGFLTVTAKNGFWLKSKARKDSHPLLKAPVANGTCGAKSE